MSYVNVQINGDFIFYADDETPLVIGNKGTLDFPWYYKVTILNSVIISHHYFEITKDFFSEYFSIQSIFALAKFRRNAKMYPFDHDFIAILINPFWKLMDSFTIDEAMKIIDDATCHGFEFKVENGEVYFREIMNNM